MAIELIMTISLNTRPQCSMSSDFIVFYNNIYDNPLNKSKIRSPHHVNFGVIILHISGQIYDTFAKNLKPQYGKHK